MITHHAITHHARNCLRAFLHFTKTSEAKWCDTSFVMALRTFAKKDRCNVASKRGFNCTADERCERDAEQDDAAQQNNLYASSGFTTFPAMSVSR